jgi:hypothetical protein
MSPAPDLRRTIASLALALGLLALLLVLLPPAPLPQHGLATSAAVRLRPTEKVRPTTAELPSPELPFLAQDEPEKFEPDHDKARTADAFNRRVDREMMARHSRPARGRAAPHSAAQLALKLGAGELQLDLSFLDRNGASVADLLDAPQDWIGGPRLPDIAVAEGDRTWLSSRRVRHGGFFRRLHRGIAQHWDPAAVLQRRDPTGMLYGSADRVTVLHIKLTRSGHLAADPAVLRGSGLQMLDAEARRAVIAAAPFANPPVALVRDGIVDLGGFSFYLEVDRSSFHFRRAR